MEFTIANALQFWNVILFFSAVGRKLLCLIFSRYQFRSPSDVRNMQLFSGMIQIPPSRIVSATINVRNGQVYPLFEPTIITGMELSKATLLRNNVFFVYGPEAKISCFLLSLEG